LKSIPGDATRPTPDRMRETLFNILQTRITGATFLDAYAGTGARRNRSAQPRRAHAFFLERDKIALDAIRQTWPRLERTRRSTVVPGAVLRTLPAYRADIVFLDPPYSLEREYGRRWSSWGQSAAPGDRAALGALRLWRNVRRAGTIAL
jgi:16S rRNA (guanine(966)-N(2))-methyltransferase RsmD